MKKSDNNKAENHQQTVKTKFVQCCTGNIKVELKTSQLVIKMNVRQKIGISMIVDVHVFE